MIFNIFSSVIIIFIKIFLSESSYIPATPPQFNVLKNSSGVNFTTLQIVFSSDGSNLTVFVGSNSISNAMSILNLNGSVICSPPSTFDLSDYLLVSNYSYLYGPITQYNDSAGSGGFQYQFWNENCSIVTSFTSQESINTGEMNLFQYPLPNAQIGGFIAILQNLTTIVQYNITNQAVNQTYTVPATIQTSSYTFSPYFIYSQDRQYLLATLNLQYQTLNTSSILAVFSCSNGSMIAHYDYPIIPKKMINSTNFLGFLFQNTSLSTQQSDLYVYSIFWSTAPVMVGQLANFAKNPQTNESNITTYAFCTNQNLFIIITSNDSTNMHNMSVYSTNPPSGKYNQLLQNITFNYSEAGQSLSMACQSNSLAVFNSEGQVFMYQYINIPVISPPTPFLWWPIVVGVAGGLLIIAIVTFIVLRYRKLRHQLVQLQHQLLSKGSQSNNNSYNDRIRMDGQQIESQNRNMRRQQSYQSKERQKQLEQQINNIYKQKYEQKLNQIKQNCDDQLRAKLKLSIWEKTSMKTQKKQLEKRQREVQIERQSISSIQKGYILDGSIIEVHQQDDQRSNRSISQVYPIQSALRGNIRDQNLQQRQKRGQSEIINHSSNIKKLNDLKLYKKSSSIKINKNNQMKIDASNQIRQSNQQAGKIQKQQTFDRNNVISLVQNDAHINSKSYKVKLRQKLQQLGGSKTQHEKNNILNNKKQFKESMIKQSVKNYKTDDVNNTLDNNARLNAKKKNQLSVPINPTIDNMIVDGKNGSQINQQIQQDQQNTKDNIKQKSIQNQVQAYKNQLELYLTELDGQ